MSDSLDFTVVAVKGGFYAAPLTDNRPEAYAARDARSRAFKAAVRAGNPVLLGGEKVSIITALHRDSFGLSQSEARGLASTLSRARIRNTIRRRGAW